MLRGYPLDTAENGGRDTWHECGRRQRICRALIRADAGTRTPDPLLTMEVLYRLSYVGVRDCTQPSAGA